MDVRRRAGAEHGVVAPVRRDAGGRDGPTRYQAGTDAWRRSSSGLYVPSDVPLTVEQRIVEAGALVPRYGALTGWASLRWQGATWFSGRDPAGQPLPVPLAMSRGWRRPQPIVRLCEERFDPREVVVVDGVPVTTPVRSVCFAMRYATNLVEAVTAFDMAAWADLVTLDEVGDYVLHHPSYTGIEQARRACLLADENAWSPQEVGLRVAWQIEAGFPRPLSNQPVFDLAGRHVGTPDVIDPDAGVIGEYDGETHLVPRSRARDRAKEDGYRALGLVVVRMVRGERRLLTERLRTAYAAAARRTGPPGWTLDPPPWWVPTTTVEQRRALGEEQRSIWLRYRIDAHDPAA